MTPPTPPRGRGTPPPETLAQVLARAAQELQAQEPPAGLRESLLRRVAPPGAPVAPAVPAAARPRWRAWAWSGGVAALAMLLVASTVLLLVPPPAAPGGGGDFVPLVAREDWPDEASAAWLVPSELPQERLAALGLPYDPARAAEPVRAELLVHPSGLVLALRLID